MSQLPPTSTVACLVRKDVSLYRWLLAGALAGVLVALVMVASGSAMLFYMGGVLLVTVLIGHGATVVVLSTVEERTKQTQPFVLSLPVSLKQYVSAKILANLLIFGAPWLLALSGSVALVLLSDKLPDGLVAYAAVVATEILMSLCWVLAAGLITRSLPWTIGTMIVFNFGFNGFIFQMFRTAGFAAAAESATIVWPPQAVSLLLAEILGMALALGVAQAVAIRRKDVL